MKHKQTDSTSTQKTHTHLILAQHQRAFCLAAGQGCKDGINATVLCVGAE